MDGSTLPVVVEVRVDVAAVFGPRSEPPRRTPQTVARRSGRGTSRGSASGPVEPHVGPVGGAHPRVASEQVVDAQGGAVAFEHREHLVVQPATGRAARRPSASCFGATVRNSSRRSVLRFQRGGSCTRLGPRCRPSRADAVEVVRQPSLRVAQLHPVRPELPELHRVREPGGRLVAPIASTVVVGGSR